MRTFARSAALAAIVAASLWAVPSAASAAPGSPAPDTPAPQSVPEDTSPGKSGSSSGPLSDKLDRTDGVIHPPPSRDAMTREPPPTGPSSTPVIPPPGTPGGDPKVEPK